jgi:4-aminobutyrate--pyruvate transaminase
VQSLAPRFQQALQQFAGRPLVGEVRGVGLIGAIELAADPARSASRSIPPEGRRRAWPNWRSSRA